jgi:hypothetical protein
MPAVAAPMTAAPRRVHCVPPDVADAMEFPMRRIMPPLLLILLLALPLAVAAQVYKWTDSSGTVHFSDSPPPQGTKYTNVKTSRSAAATPVAGTPAPAAATDADQPAEKPERIEDTPENRSKLCTDLKANIALLQGGQPLTVDDDKGQRVAMPDERRRQELATAEGQAKQYCQ